MPISRTRTARILWAGCLLLALARPGPARTLKIGTLAPEGSTWIQALRDIDSELRDRSAGALQLKIYPGGVQGDEDVMLRKMRIGQLQGAGLGGTGISYINRDVLAYQMPFLFDGYDEVDYVMAAMDDYLRRGFETAGYELLAWTDIGFVYLLSKRAIADVDDLHGLKVWRLKEEPITGALFKQAGVTSVPLGIPDVLLGLQTNLIDVVYAPPSAAIVLQWFTRVLYYTDLPINYSNGALVVSRRAFEGLDPQQQTLLHEVCRRRVAALNQRNRQDNAEALQIMQHEGVAPVTPPPEAIGAFRELVRRATPELVGHAFSREAYDRVLQNLAAFRAVAADSAGGATTP